MFNLEKTFITKQHQKIKTVTEGIINLKGNRLSHGHFSVEYSVWSDIHTIMDLWAGGHYTSAPDWLFLAAVRTTNML